MQQYPDLLGGTSAWFYDALAAQLPQINAELAARIVGVAPVFVLAFGRQVNVSQPTIAVIVDYAQPPQLIAQHSYNHFVGATAVIYIPHVASDTSGAYEVCKQVCSNNLVQMFSSDEALSLRPAINAGIIPLLYAENTNLSRVLECFPLRMADDKTVVRAFERTLTVVFNLQFS